MSFENIQLPDFLLAELYKNCIVELDKIEPQNSPAIAGIEQPIITEEITEKKPLRFLGENKRNVCVLVNDPESVFLDTADLQFLTNVLKACKLNMGDIAVVNLNHQTIGYLQLQTELQPKQVLLFDVETTSIKLPFSIPDFQPQAFAGTTYLKAPALKSINNDTSLKVSLWNNLQKLFSL